MVADRRGDITDGGFEQSKGVPALLVGVEPGDGADVYPLYIVAQPPVGHVVSMGSPARRVLMVSAWMAAALRIQRSRSVMYTSSTRQSVVST